MSQGPRHINTDRSLNRPTEQRPTEASALHQVSLSGQPDFFQNEQPAPQQMRVHWKRHILAESTIWIRRKGNSIASILESTELQKMQQIL